MAWRIDADADRHIRTGNAPGGDATICAFVYMSVNRAAFSCPLILDDNTTGGGGTASQYYIETLTDGNSIQVFWRSTAGTSGNTATIAVVQLKTWYFIAMRRSGTTITGYVKRVGSAQWAKQSTTTSGTVAPTHIRVGGCDPVFTSEFWNGRVAGVRVWNAAINEIELWRESFQLSPRARPQNLYMAWQDNTALDMSGKGRHPTTKGTASLEMGPLVPVYSNQPVILDHVQGPTGPVAMNPTLISRYKHTLIRRAA